MRLWKTSRKILNLDGRHTYLYAPGKNDDIDCVIKHLHRAGIVVLLLVDKNRQIPFRIRVNRT